MKWPILIRPRAEEDLREARRWYEQRRQGLGDELVAAVRRAIRALEADPERRPFYYREFRRLLMRQFPYKVFHLVERDRVVVFRIPHARQDHPPRLNE